MTIVYDVFAGSPSGGPVDYSAPVATTAGLSVTLVQSPGATVRYAVRARDTLSGLSELNTDATALVRTGPSGSDQTGLPPAPVHLRTIPGPGGTAAAEWAYPFLSPQSPPQGFRVYLGPVGAVNYAVPAGVVPSGGVSRARFSFRAGLAGLSPGVYSVGVRAFNAAGEEGNTSVATLTVAVSAPPAVSSLAGAATF